MLFVKLLVTPFSKDACTHLWMLIFTLLNLTRHLPFMQLRFRNVSYRRLVRNMSYTGEWAYFSIIFFYCWCCSFTGIRILVLSCCFCLHFSLFEALKYHLLWVSEVYVWALGVPFSQFGLNNPSNILCIQFIFPINNSIIVLPAWIFLCWWWWNCPCWIRTGVIFVSSTLQSMTSLQLLNHIESVTVNSW